MSSRAFCPAHITGFFSVPLDREKRDEKMGSRGAGFSVELGAYAEAEVGGQGWDLTINGEETSFMVVEKTVRGFAKGGTIKIETDVPFSQGFGMSGACALSSAIAVLSEIDSRGEDALKEALHVAHRSELFCRTGLGDVVGQYTGGFETRVKPGLPPNGEVKKEERDEEVVLAVVGSPLSTPDMLKDPFMAAWINAIGDDMMEDFLPEDGFDRFIELSYKFAKETQFLRDGMEPLIEKANEYGKGSMAMIGNTLFYIGETERLKELFEEEVGQEKVYVTRIDNQGARLLDG